jgi:DNA polymerase-1
MRDHTCQLCPLWQTARSVNVDGEWWGDLDWDGPVVMCIGINPGGQEDREGRPFIGPSGAMLKHALESAGIRSAFLTNAFGCVGEPDMEYARACAAYLEDEIKRIQPQWILALGNIPLQRLLGRGTVGAMSGKEVWSDRYGCWILPAPHPAAVLRNMGREPSWLADIMRYGRLIRGELSPPPAVPPVSVELVSTSTGLVKLRREIQHSPLVAYDFETNAVDWWSNEFRPLTIGFAFEGTSAQVVPLCHAETDAAWRAMVLGWLTSLGPIQGLVHNGVFDDLVWYRLTQALPRPRWDTMVGLHLLDENAPKGLKWAGRAHLGWPDWDINARRQHTLSELYPYNGYDAAVLPLLYEREMDILHEDAWLLAYAETVEMPKLRALERMLARGIYVDRSTTARLLHQAWQAQQAADRSVPIANPASHPQVAAWLYQTLGLPVLVQGKKHPSTAESVVNRLAQQHPEARKILDCRRPRKKISTYFRPVARDTRRSFDGRLHPEYRTTSVETGRLSSFFHTTPRGTSVRPMFSAPPGRVLISADYRQIEARLCAWLALGRPETWHGVPRGSMLWAFHEGADIYRLFAAMALGKHPKLITKDERQIMGKVPILAQIYKISWQGLQEYAWKVAEVDWPDHVARKLHDLFDRVFPEFPVWHRFEEMKLRQQGWTRSPIGRVRRLPDAVYGNREALNSGINMPSQSLASDITQVAMVILDELGFAVVGNVHDALLIESSDAARDAPIIREAMTTRALERLGGLGLRLPEGLVEVEITAGPWGLGEDIAA